MRAKINKNLLKQNINQALEKNSPIIKNAEIIATEAIEIEKEKYINQIENHPVSQEILDGPSAANISRTLDGEGNLFSFIGFEKSDNPINKIKILIKNNTFIKFKNAKNGIFNFSVFTPSLEEIYQETPMPFEGGKSWVKGIEKGISGFSNYLYGLIFQESRSGKAIQSKNRIRKSNFKPRSYLSQVYINFLKNFKI